VRDARDITPLFRRRAGPARRPMFELLHRFSRHFPANRFAFILLILDINFAIPQ
jgi:hypothetical protein